MSSSQQLYHTIKNLQQTLDGKVSATITSRRKAGNELTQLLANIATWKRLAAVLQVPPTRAAARMKRYRGLAGIFEVALKSAMKFVRSFLTSKTKARLTLEDTKLPFRLLRGSYSALRQLYDSETLMMSVALNKKMTLSLVEFCLDLLEDEDACTKVNELPKAMVELLAFVCDKTECVAHFRQDKHMLTILDDIDTIVLGDETPSKDQVDWAGRVFYNLISSAHKVGLAMHLLVRTSLGMIAALAGKIKNHEDPSIFWCVRNFLQGAAILMRANPDLAIEPLREYGEALSGLVHQCVLPSRSLGAANDQLFEVIQDYYTSHL